MTIKAIILDTETTGLNLPQVIEMAYMPINDDININPQAVVSERFMPRKMIEAEAVTIHGIYDLDLIGKPDTGSIISVMPLVAKVEYIIGHNIEYDVGAINNSTSVAYSFKGICTKRLAVNAYPQERSHKLTRLVERFLKQEAEDYIGDAHSAKADVVMCGLLLKHIARTLSERDNKPYTLDDLYELSIRADYNTYGRQQA